MQTSGLEVCEEWMQFLKILGEKKPDEVITHYQKGIDFLTIVSGTSNDWSDYMVGGIIIPGIDVVLQWKGHSGAPEEMFAGIEIWGGAHGMLS